MRALLLLACSLRLAGRLTAQDSSFAAMQARGTMAMGVDQYTSWHRFDPLPDGGCIKLQRDSSDTAGPTAVREHLKDNAIRVRAGDLSIPALVPAPQGRGTPLIAGRSTAMR